MATDTGGIDRALGAIGTTFRLTRLYPPTHPAVVEALRQVTAALPALAAIGTLEWKIGATGLHWHGQHLLPRNSQMAELAGLLYARGLRSIQVHPGLAAEHVVAVAGGATGSVAPDDGARGQIPLTVGRRTQRFATPAPVDPTPAAELPARLSAPPAPSAATVDAVARRASGAFRPDVVPVAVQVKRAIAGLKAAATLDAQRAAVEQLQAMTPSLLALRDVVAVAEAIGGLDRLLLTVADPALLTAIGAAAEAPAGRGTAERMGGRAASPPAAAPNAVLCAERKKK